MNETIAGRIIAIFKIWECPELIGRYPAHGKQYGLWEGYQTSAEYREYLKSIGDNPDTPENRHLAEIYAEKERQVKEVEGLFDCCKEDYPFIYDYFREKKAAVRGKERPLSLTKVQRKALISLLGNSRETNMTTLGCIERRFARIYRDLLGHKDFDSKRTRLHDDDKKIMEKLHLFISLDSSFYLHYMAHKTKGTLTAEMEKEVEVSSPEMLVAENKYPFIYQYCTRKNRDYFSFHAISQETIEIEQTVEKMLLELEEPANEKLGIVNERIKTLLCRDAVKEQEQLPEGKGTAGMIKEFAHLKDLKPKDISIIVYPERKGKELTIKVGNIMKKGGYELLDLRWNRVDASGERKIRAGICTFFENLARMKSQYKDVNSDTRSKYEKHISGKDEVEINKWVKYISELNRIFRVKFPLGEGVKSFKKLENTVPEALFALDIVYSKNVLDKYAKKREEMLLARLRNEEFCQEES